MSNIQRIVFFMFFPTFIARSTESKVSIFGVFLFCIFRHSGWNRRLIQTKKTQNADTFYVRASCNLFERIYLNFVPNLMTLNECLMFWFQWARSCLRKRLSEYFWMILLLNDPPIFHSINKYESYEYVFGKPLMTVDHMPYLYH